MVHHFNVQGHYLAELRVLTTGAATAEHSDICAGGEHTKTFRRRPEMRVMSRPAVRNVRTLHIERELSHTY